MVQLDPSVHVWPFTVADGVASIELGMALAATNCPLLFVPTEATEVGTGALSTLATVGFGYAPLRSPPAVPVIPPG